MKQLIMICAGAALLWSCSGHDDDKAYQGGSEPGSAVDVTAVAANAVYTTPSGNQLVASAIGDFSFAYNRRLLPLEAGDVTVNYATGTLTYSFAGSDGKPATGTAAFGIDARGFITALEFSEQSMAGATVQFTNRGTVKLVYSPKGYLTRWEESSTVAEKDYAAGLDRQVSRSVVRSLDWADGSLAGVDVATCDDEGPNGSVIESRAYTDFGSGSDDLDNSLRQYTMSYATAAVPVRFQALALAGMFGTAPATLPHRSVTEQQASGDGDALPSAVATVWAYTLNSNLTIQCERANGTVAGGYEEHLIWYYGYSFVD